MTVAWSAGGARGRGATMGRTIKLPPIPESEVQRNGMAWLRSQGCQVYRRNTGGMYDARGNFVQFSERGACDSWAISPAGIHLEVEWKRFGERPTLDQVLWLLKTNGHGHSASFWVDNLATLERVYRHVAKGGRIAYCNDVRRYRIKGRDVWGPSGEFDLIGRLERGEP
jgi:hypothetical protein